MSEGRIELSVVPHPALRLLAGELFCEGAQPPASPEWLAELLGPQAEAPIARDEQVRRAVRDSLRHHGYRPTGRGKPASEYLARAAAEGKLPSIHPAVDLGNAVSLHSGVPISVVDLDRLATPLRVAVASDRDRYVFNAAGQEIDLAGLPCLFDAKGPCANAVKDALRTKADAATTRTLAILWGCGTLGPHLDAAREWFVELAARAGWQWRDATVRLSH